MAKITARIKLEDSETGKWREHDVPANSVGEFFAVHRDVIGTSIDSGAPVFDGCTWNVTHLPSGYKAAYSPYKRSAMHAARLLAALDLPWGSMTVEQAKAIAGPVRDQIDHICGMARIGAMA